MNPTPERVDLRDIALFAGLTTAQLDTLAGKVRLRLYDAGQTIISAEEPGTTAFIIRTGFVRVHVEQTDGGDITLAILGPGELVGEMSLVDHLTRSASVVAHQPVTLLAFDRAAFWNCLNTIPLIGVNLATILSRRLRIANAHIQSLAALEVPARVAFQLSMLAEEYGCPADRGGVAIPFALSQSDLAGLVGASRVRVNQILVAYRRQGLIDIDRERRIIIREAEALAACTAPTNS